MWKVGLEEMAKLQFGFVFSSADNKRSCKIKQASDCVALYIMCDLYTFWSWRAKGKYFGNPLYAWWLKINYGERMLVSHPNLPSPQKVGSTKFYAVVCNFSNSTQIFQLSHTQC